MGHIRALISTGMGPEVSKGLAKCLKGLARGCYRAIVECTSCITVVPSTLPTSFDDSGRQDGPAQLGSAGQGSSACRIVREFFRGGLVPPLANMPWRTQAGFLRPLPAVQQREHRQAL